jgi:hypothetical protein
VTIPQTYHGVIGSALVQTGIIILLSALIMDFGDTLRVNLVAALVFWGWTFVAIYRRPDKPAAMDLSLIRSGLIPFVISFWVVVHMAWSLRGLS